MEKKQTHREPTLFIVGNIERKDEIRRILEDEWGGIGHSALKYDNSRMAYYISTMGYIDSCDVDFCMFEESIANGWMKEYKLSKPQFKPFDKVVVKLSGSAWKPALFGYIDKNYCWLQGYGWVYVDKSIILPYNEQTAKLIGTSNEWKGEDNE